MCASSRSSRRESRTPCWRGHSQSLSELKSVVAAGAIGVERVLALAATATAAAAGGGGGGGGGGQRNLKEKAIGQLWMKKDSLLLGAWLTRYWCFQLQARSLFTCDWARAKETEREHPPLFSSSSPPSFFFQGDSVVCVCLEREPLSRTDGACSDWLTDWQLSTSSSFYCRRMDVAKHAHTILRGLLALKKKIFPLLRLTDASRHLSLIPPQQKLRLHIKSEFLMPFKCCLRLFQKPKIQNRKKRKIKIHITKQ